MRRKEYEITDIDEIVEFINEQKTGVLSFCNESGIPSGIPMSYVYHDSKIFMHSGPQGEKASSLINGKKVHFTIFKEYSYIPNYFTGKDSPCTASQFYKSVMISGHLEMIDDIRQKAVIFKMLMEKFQPEGKYDDLSADSYEKMLDVTLVPGIIPEKITAKFKFGQNLDDDLIETIIDNLAGRKTPVDRETIEMIKRYRKKKI